MKFYNSIGPNPKLVRMFAAEKGWALPNVTEVDLMGGDNRKEPYTKKNPAGQLPGLELDDGTFLAETLPLCEYIEELQPAPALIGTTPEERAETRMWTRRVDLKINCPMADGFRFSEGLGLFKDRMRTLPDSADGLKAIARDGMEWLDGQIVGRTTIVPGRFSLADVSFYAFAEFGIGIGQPIDPALKNLTAWFEATKQRPSAEA